MSKSEINQLVAAYKSIFNTQNGREVLSDLRKFSGIDEQSGSELTHAQCAYRNALQDVVRYIEAMVSEDE